MVLGVKNPPANAGDARVEGLIPGLGRSLEREMATSSSVLFFFFLMKIYLFLIEG